MRHRPNLEPRMEKCRELMQESPESMKGRWHGDFSKLYLELGCGKGRFTADLAASERGTRLVALEKVPDAMIIAMERVRQKELDNVIFIDGDAAMIKDYFEDGEVDRLFINFCDPWIKSRDAKYRLTGPAFLRRYADILPEGGEIHFKTDNDALFKWSLAQFEEENWELSDISNDYKSEFMTDYEAKFTAEGVKINHLVAAKKADTKSTKDGEVPRLKNAGLKDLI